MVTTLEHIPTTTIDNTSSISHTSVVDTHPTPASQSIVCSKSTTESIFSRSTSNAQASSTSTFSVILSSAQPISTSSTSVSNTQPTPVSIFGTPLSSSTSISNSHPIQSSSQSTYSNANIFNNHYADANLDFHYFNDNAIVISTSTTYTSATTTIDSTTELPETSDLSFLEYTDDKDLENNIHIQVYII